MSFDQHQGHDSLKDLKICPRCGKELESGWIYNSSFYNFGSLYWYKERRLSRKFSWLFIPKFFGRWIEARRCKHCSLMLFESEDPSAKKAGRKILIAVLIGISIVFALWFFLVGIPLLRLWTLIR